MVLRAIHDNWVATACAVGVVLVATGVTERTASDGCQIFPTRYVDITVVAVSCAPTDRIIAVRHVIAYGTPVVVVPHQEQPLDIGTGLGRGIKHDIPLLTQPHVFVRVHSGGEELGGGGEGLRGGGEGLGGGGEGRGGGGEGEGGGGEGLGGGGDGGGANGGAGGG